MPTEVHVELTSKFLKFVILASTLLVKQNIQEITFILEVLEPPSLCTVQIGEFYSIQNSEMKFLETRNPL